MVQKIFLLACIIVFVNMHVSAQAPGKFNYQAIARDNNGAVIASHAITLRISILENDPDGRSLYTETFSLTTSSLGLFAAAIGGGTPISGAFADISWGNSSKFLKTEIDFNDGKGMQAAGVAQLLSVPYALFAQRAAGNDQWTSSGIDMYTTNRGNVGIGTTVPQAKLHVRDSSVLFSSVLTSFPANPGPPPSAGIGSRQFWYAGKGAFRTGGNDANGSLGNDIFDLPDGTHYWDQDSIGVMSFAAGYNNRAKGAFSTAVGAQSTTYGAASFAAGVGSTAVNSADIAIGSNNLAAGGSSVALGSHNRASGAGSFAAGNDNIANGTFSTAMGSHANTNGHTGVFLIGDASGQSTVAGDDNQFKAFFSGGYMLLTSEEGTTEKGAVILKGDVSWSVLSDSTTKTSFLPLEGEALLGKFNQFKQLGSWSYKGQDPRMQRHYGPMAQDFHQAFGQDGVGRSGNDTLINSSDMSGVLFIAAHALKMRTDVLMQQVSGQQASIEQLTSSNARLVSDKQQLQNELQAIRDQYAQMAAQINRLIDLTAASSVPGH